MFNKNNLIKTILFLTIFMIFISIKVSANNHLKLSEDFTIEDSKNFIKNDKKYLNTNPSKSTINKEIKKLEKDLIKINNEYELINGIKIYKGNTGLKNNAIRTAIKNRETYLKNKSSFNYNDSTIYNIDRGYTQEAGTNRYFSQKDMDLTYDAIVQVITNIELDTSFLNNTTFVVSPFILEGMNGYTLSRNNNKNTIVISNHIFGAPKDWVKLSIKSTILHEIGHVFQINNQDKFKNNLIIKEYLIQADKNLSSNNNNDNDSSINKKWESSINENFAEDFRIYFSTRLNKKSFEPLAKKTSTEYNHKSFSKVISAITQ